MRRRPEGGPMRRFLAMVALLVVAASASASGVYSDAQKLKTDVDARIAAIPATTKEAKNLTKASAKLATYGGGSTVADFKILAAAGKFLAASGTQDQPIKDDASALVHDFCDCAAERHDAALAAIDLL